MGARIIIRTRSQKVEINMVFYHRPEEVIKFIQDQIRNKDLTGGECKGNNITT